MSLGILTIGLSIKVATATGLPAQPANVVVNTSYDDQSLSAWEEAMEQVREAFPADIEPPRTFSDLALQRKLTCSSEDMISFGSRAVPCWLVETIVQAAYETDTDAVYLLALADKESSFRWDAKASTSTARGLFQFLNGTWLEVIKDYGAQHNLEEEAAAIVSKGGKLMIEDKVMSERVMNLRYNPYVAAVMAAELLKRDAARVEERLGRELFRSEYYFTHFLGASSASKLMRAKASKPSTAASKLLPKAARANKSLFVSRKGKKTRAITVAEFHQRLEGMMKYRFEKYAKLETAVVAQADIPEQE
ncbi:lytic transglycosylase domain-containing protein [Microvirga sp. W0021]|uniref:Lytic transglycosylase domain-containing protein n=1 Tax=Hohaiivirga grylli TaxID=3133970 RepID=A0ABV0BG48_9HYPH